MTNSTISALTVASTGKYYIPVVQGGVTLRLANNVTTVPPTTTDDSTAGYGVGSRWMDTTADILWLCNDATSSAAKWQKLGTASSLSYISGNWYDLFSDSYTASAASTSAALQLWEFDIPERVTLSQLGIYVSTLGTTTAMVGIYANSQTTSRPTGNVLASVTGLVNTSTGPVSAALGSNVTFNPGSYWAAGMSGDSTARYGSTMNTTNRLGRIAGDATLANVASAGVMNMTAPATYGTFPDLTSASFTVGSVVTARAMRIYGKVA